MDDPHTLRFDMIYKGGPGLKKEYTSPALVLLGAWDSRDLDANPH